LSHWKAYKEGKITLREARTLQMLKNKGRLKEYHKREKKLGI